MFYELLTGRLPLGRYEPPSHRVALAGGTPDVKLDEIVLRALEVEPERRYQSVGDVRTDVERVGSVPRDVVDPSAPTLPDRPRETVRMDGEPPELSAKAFAGSLFLLIAVVACAAGVWGAGRSAINLIDGIDTFAHGGPIEEVDAAFGRGGIEGRGYEQRGSSRIFSARTLAGPIALTNERGMDGPGRTGISPRSSPTPP